VTVERDLNDLTTDRSADPAYEEVAELGPVPPLEGDALGGPDVDPDRDDVVDPAPPVAALTSRPVPVCVQRNK
jgi:hypothetical protein